MLQYVGETVRQHIEGRGEGQATDPPPSWDLQVSANTSYMYKRTNIDISACTWLYYIVLNIINV